ncbi:hypothetical protein DMJ13_02285 [halophilic archaeon]|nr:hypothetical protein DMJ13_02285 [halophilic archaeon]
MDAFKTGSEQRRIEMRWHASCNQCSWEDSFSTAFAAYYAAGRHEERREHSLIAVWSDGPD